MADSKLNKAFQSLVDYPSRTGERTIVLFDAVMAIAITLMVLEIGIPEAESFSATQVKDLFIPFTALCVSFVALGQLWYLHAKAYASETMVRNTSIPAHLALMFLIVLFPKTTELIAQYPTSSYAIAIYLICYVLLVICEFATVISGYRKQSNRFDRWMDKNYGVTLNGALFAKVRTKSDWHNDLVVAIAKVARSVSAEVVLAIVTTCGAVFALFLCPPVCYAFFVIEIAGAAYVSHRTKPSWEIINQAWSRFEISMAEEDAPTEMIS